MTDYHSNINLLTLYAHLTPWVQALLVLGICSVVLGVAYICKETIATLIKPFYRCDQRMCGDHPQWKKFHKENMQRLDHLLEIGKRDFGLKVPEKMPFPEK